MENDEDEILKKAEFKAKQVMELINQFRKRTRYKDGVYSEAEKSLDF